MPYCIGTVRRSGDNCQAGQRQHVVESQDGAVEDHVSRFRCSIEKRSFFIYLFASMSLSHKPLG